MGHSNGMGFFRRMNWGQYREDWNSGERRQIRKHEAQEEILAETTETTETKRCSKCGSPDHVNPEDS